MYILANVTGGFGDMVHVWQQGGTVGVVLLMLWGFRYYLNERDAKDQAAVDKNNARMDTVIANHQAQVQALTNSFQAQITNVSQNFQHQIESLAKDTRDQVHEMTSGLALVANEVKDLAHKIEGARRGE